MYNGFIFEKEIDNNSFCYQLKFAYNYAEKIFRDIAYSYIAIIYPPYLVAFVIIYLTRKEFFEQKYMKKIKKFYGIKQNDYKECYEDILNFLEKIENGLKISDYNTINKAKNDEKEIKEKKNNEKENNNEIEKEKVINEKENIKNPESQEKSEKKTSFINQIKEAINKVKDENNIEKTELSEKHEEK